MARFVLTGPTGWLGANFLDTFAAVLGADWTSEVRLFGSAERDLRAPDGSVVSVRSLMRISADDVDGAIVIHLAYLTKEKVSAGGPSAFITANTSIDDAVLAALEAGRPRSVFVASSGAAKQAESGVGRELYGLCKLVQEERFLGWGARTGTPVIAGRIFNLAGPHMNKLDSYAVGVLLSQALREGRARIQAQVPVYRSYLHVGDMCRLVLGALEQDYAPDKAVDLCGALVVEMEDVAREVLRSVGLSDDRIDRDPVDFDRPSIYLGDPEPVRTLALRLRLKLQSFARQIDDTAADLGKRVPKR